MSLRRLTESQVLGIRADLDRISDRAIAKKYGVHEFQIDAIAAGHLYGDVVSPKPPLPSRHYPGERPRYGR